MHAAVEKENIELIQLLLNCKDIDINVKDEIQNLQKSSNFMYKVLWFLLVICENVQSNILIMMKLNKFSVFE